MILDESERNEISTAIADIESKTDAELVTVLARRADSYLYIPTLWAALVSLALPVLFKFTPLWLSANELLVTQWTAFILLTALFHIPFIMRKLIPRQVGHWRASNLARRQFLENNLHHTKNAMGVLIFVSEAEHYVEIIADRGISHQVSDDQWQEFVDAFVSRVKAGQIKAGFLECIESCGTLLIEHAPASEAKNELPDHLVILE